MPKRLADDTLTDEVVESPSPTASQSAPPSGTNDIPNHGRHHEHQQALSHHRSANKRFYLKPSSDETPKADHMASLNLASREGTKNATTGAGHEIKTEQPDLETKLEIFKTNNEEKEQHESSEVGATENGTRDNKKNLVTSVMDLPVFVTIEGNRVASYLIDGEPHLCLPQLLQFIQEKFPLEKVIDMFEESQTNFVSATPKQVDGLIKAIVLPHSATTCPLIKRSDAEWICLALYDQKSMENWGNIVDLCSRSDISLKDKLNVSEKYLNELDKRADDGDTTCVKEIAEVKEDRRSPSEESFRSSSGRISQEAFSDKEDEEPNTSMPKFTQITPKDDPVSLSSLTDVKPEAATDTSSSYVGRRPSPDHSPELKGRQRLFENVAQETILNLAQTVTSTLRIRVYHRCFGKCVGLYYPSLLSSSESDCIECSSCRKMLSPRRFIGHSHGAREVNVCHWGFNSYNWRNYIRLSQKQSMNNLDDDELLVQINLLKSARDEVSGLETTFQDTMSEHMRTSEQFENVVPKENQVVQLQRLAAPKSANQSAPIGLDRKTSVNNHPVQSSRSRGPLEELALLTPSCSSQAQDNRTNSPYLASSPSTSSHFWMANQVSTIPNMHTRLPLTDLAGTSKACPASILYEPSTSSHLSTSAGFLLPRLPPPYSITNLADQLHGEADFAHLATALTSDALTQLTTTDRQFKQDLFVSSSLSNYLNSKGVHPKLTEEIVTSTIGFIQRARTIY